MTFNVRHTIYYDIFVFIRTRSGTLITKGIFSSGSGGKSNKKFVFLCHEQAERKNTRKNAHMADKVARAVATEDENA